MNKTIFLFTKEKNDSNGYPKELNVSFWIKYSYIALDKEIHITNTNFSKDQKEKIPKSLVESLSFHRLDKYELNLFHELGLSAKGFVMTEAENPLFSTEDNQMIINFKKNGLYGFFPKNCVSLEMCYGVQINDNTQDCEIHKESLHDIMLSDNSFRFYICFKKDTNFYARYRYVKNKIFHDPSEDRLIIKMSFVFEKLCHTIK